MWSVLFVIHSSDALSKLKDKELEERSLRVNIEIIMHIH